MNWALTLAMLGAIVIAGCASTVAGTADIHAGLTEFHAQSDAFVRADLENALALAKHPPPDSQGEKCWTVLLTLLPEPGAEAPVASGAASGIELARKIRRIGTNSNDDINIACAPVLMDIVATLAKLGLRIPALP